MRPQAALGGTPERPNNNQLARRLRLRAAAWSAGEQKTGRAKMSFFCEYRFFSVSPHLISIAAFWRFRFFFVVTRNASKPGRNDHPPPKSKQRNQQSGEKQRRRHNVLRGAANVVFARPRRPGDRGAGGLTRLVFVMRE